MPEGDVEASIWLVHKRDHTILWPKLTCQGMQLHYCILRSSHTREYILHLPQKKQAGFGKPSADLDTNTESYK